jgi:hypothetical protein
MNKQGKKLLQDMNYNRTGAHHEQNTSGIEVALHIHELQSHGCSHLGYHLRTKTRMGETKSRLGKNRNKLHELISNKKITEAIKIQIGNNGGPGHPSTPNERLPSIGLPPVLFASPATTPTATAPLPVAESS